eukprot:scaffold614851_cov37-Prasinocladus_malaysianus.AAC.1
MALMSCPICVSKGVSPGVLAAAADIYVRDGGVSAQGGQHVGEVAKHCFSAETPGALANLPVREDDDDGGQPSERGGSDEEGLS